MKAFDAGCGDQEFAQVFVKDEFYESFEAPKFHDFTAAEEPIDPDAWFRAKAGKLSSFVSKVSSLKRSEKRQQWFSVLLWWNTQPRLSTNIMSRLLSWRHIISLMRISEPWCVNGQKLWAFPYSLFMWCVERKKLTDPVCAGMTRKEEARIQEYESFLQNPKTQKVVIFLHTPAFSFASIASNTLSSYILLSFHCFQQLIHAVH